MAVTLTSAWKLLGETNLGSFGYGTLYLQLFGRLETQDIVNNKSKYTIYSRVNNVGSYCNSGNCYAYLDGTTVKNNVSLQFPANNYVDLGTKTITVVHDQNGEKSETKSASFSCYAGTNGSVTATFSLPTIARASSIACTTANIGEVATIIVNKKNSNFTHTLEYWFRKFKRYYCF